MSFECFLGRRLMYGLRGCGKRGWDYLTYVGEVTHILWGKRLYRALSR